MPVEQAALIWHLHHNHYPPLPYQFLPLAEKAIDMANANQQEQEIDFPGLGLRDDLTVGEVVEALHLDDFIEEI